MRIITAPSKTQNRISLCPRKQCRSCLSNMSDEVAVTGKPAVRPPQSNMTCLWRLRLCSLSTNSATEHWKLVCFWATELHYLVVMALCRHKELAGRICLFLKLCRMCFNAFKGAVSSHFMWNCEWDIVAEACLARELPPWREVSPGARSTSVHLQEQRDRWGTLFINIDPCLSECRVIFQTLLRVPLCSGCAAVTLMPCTGTLECRCPTSRPLSAGNVSVQRWGRLCALNQATSRPLCR